MNGEWIRKVIKLNYKTCPVFTYESPLLEKKVANHLATTLITLINSDQTPSEYRILILKKLRKLCKDEPGDHLCSDDDVTDMLVKCYEENLKSSDKNQSIEEMLDNFLIRDLKEINISPKYAPAIKPETIQALTNLKGSRIDMESVRLNNINWNICGGDNINLKVLESIWDADILSDNAIRETELVIPDDSAIKMKPLTEKLLLDICYEILNTQVIDLIDWCESNKNLQGLIKMCSESSEWFQICTSIINSIYIKVNFDKQLQQFIDIFINEFVKVQCTNVYFSTLYPTNLSHLVTLLDINTRDISYITSTTKHLEKLHNESENDLIMLLSHFTNWFRLYQNFRKHKYIPAPFYVKVENPIMGL